jgi:hypothetical protein
VRVYGMIGCMYAYASSIWAAALVVCELPSRRLSRSIERSHVCVTYLVSIFMRKPSSEAFESDQ